MSTRFIGFLLLLILVAQQTAYGQTYHKITALSGIQTVGGKAVTITSSGSSAGSPLPGGCILPVYKVGTNSAYNYSFSSPVYKVKVVLTGIDGQQATNRDTCQISINGTPYVLTPSNVSLGTPISCATNLNGTPTVTSVGTLTSTTVFNHKSPIQVEIQTPTINSVQVFCDSLDAVGFHYDIYFADTGLIIQQPYTDTIKCPGDSLYLPYGVFAPFGSTNVFTAQLSNSSGSFASPTVIGTLSSGTTGTIAAKLSQSIAADSGYKVRIVSSNPARISDTIPMRILSGPNAVPVAGSNAPFCAGGTLNLTSTNAGTGVSYSWTGPGAYTSGSQNPSISNAQTSHSGDYIVTASAGTCSRRDTITVLVKPFPATPTVNNNGPLCPGDNLGLTSNNTTAGVTYSWSGPGSYSSSQQNPSILNVTGGQAGVYTVTTDLNGCSTSAQTTVVVKPVPAVPTVGSNSPVCAGGTVNLTASSITGGVSYSWNGPNGFTSNLQNPVVNPAGLVNAGIYSVTAALNGCISAAATTNVAVNNVSSIGVYPSPNDTLCQMGPNATFVAVPSNGGSSPQYQWFKNGNLISGATSLSFPATSIANSDTFYCRMTATGICSDPLVLFSNKVGMTVLAPAPPPTINIAASPGTLLSPWQTVSFTATPGGNSGSNPKYQWKRNGNNIIGATSNNWNANNLSDNDEISCEITSSAWCANPDKVESSKIAIHIKTGIDDVMTDHYRVYPNPVTDELTIEGEAGMKVSIVNVLGQEVYSGVLTGNKISINTTGFAPGSYILQLTANDGRRNTVNLVKQ